MAETRVCVARTSNGVPVGAQMAWPAWTSTGWPATSTRVAALTHVAVTHGPLAIDGGGSVHPATTHGAGNVVTGCPLTVTRGLGAVGCAWPPWMHCTVAPRWTTKPGTQITTNAPLLMVTVGPVMIRLAPLPFWM